MSQMRLLVECFLTRIQNNYIKYKIAVQKTTTRNLKFLKVSVWQCISLFDCFLLTFVSKVHLH